jgi:hypothetical protein
MPEDSESHAPENTESSQTQQFAISMLQRRNQNQKSLQLAKRLQAKYPSDAPDIDCLIAEKLRLILSKRLIGARRSLNQKPLRFEALPLQFAANAPAIATTAPPAPKAFAQSPLRFEALPLQFAANAPAIATTAPPAPKAFVQSPSAKRIEPSRPSETITTDKKSKRSLEESKLEARIERSSPLILDPNLKDRLSQILNIRIPNVKIYANELADSLVKKYNADALTYPDKILFRADKYAPTKKEGIALLGHELTHAAQLSTQDPDALENRDTQEREALINEQNVLHYTSLLEVNRNHPETTRDYKTLPTLNFSAKQPENTQPAPAQAQLPTMASSSRNLSLPIESTATSMPPSHLSEAQLGLIKEEVYRDLMQRIRVEFERGS